ncbi:hypothetical protein QTP86_017047, partial [Hemibagrus guttatus]
THTLQYFYTAVTPEFTAVSLVDGEVSEYYDSNIRKTIPKTEWIKKADADDPYYWYRETQVWNDEQEWLKHDVVTALISALIRPECFNISVSADPPTASVFQKHSPYPEVVCHATDFFHKAVNISWKKDGEDVNEDVEVRETLPNQDGSFQKRSILKVPAEELQKHTYTCVIQHSSLKEELVLEVPKGPDPLHIQNKE